MGEPRLLSGEVVGPISMVLAARPVSRGPAQAHKSLRGIPVLGEPAEGVWVSVRR